MHQLLFPVPTNIKLKGQLLAQDVELGSLKCKREAAKAAMAESVRRSQQLRILRLAGKLDFDPEWDYKRLRRRCSCK